MIRKNRTPASKLGGGLQSSCSSAARLEGRSNRLKRLSLKRSDNQISSKADAAGGRKAIHIEIDKQINRYEFNVNFYSIPPFGDVQLKEAEQFVQERISILKTFSDLRANAVGLSSTAYYESLSSNLRNLNGGHNFLVESCYGADNPKTQAARRRDHVSHFLLRLYCCRNEELRKWFMHQETELLRYRLMDNKNPVDLSRFLEYNNLNYVLVSEAEKRDLLNKIYNGYNFTQRTNFYKIPFEECLEMVANRRVYVNGGYCYISDMQMPSIICMRFKLELSQALASLSSRLPQLEEEHRLLPMMDQLYKQQVGDRRKKLQIEATGDQILPDMIDDLAKEFFPPCMRHIHEHLREQHHLKHYGRLYYGLFLKSIGLRMEDALTFFRDEFVQKVTPERFQREYAYNIRYNYGKEGKRVALSAYSCAKIQNENAPGAGDAHGCPFKHFDVNNLTNMLRKYQISEENISEMVQLSTSKNYGAACTQYFCCKNPGYQLEEKGIIHPSQFYRDARKASTGHKGTTQAQDANEAAMLAEDDFADEFMDDDFDYTLITQENLADTTGQANDDSPSQEDADLKQASPENLADAIEQVNEDSASQEEDADLKQKSPENSADTTEQINGNSPRQDPDLKQKSSENLADAIEQVNDDSASQEEDADLKHKSPENLADTTEQINGNSPRQEDANLKRKSPDDEVEREEEKADVNTDKKLKFADDTSTETIASAI